MSFTLYYPRDSKFCALSEKKRKERSKVGPAQAPGGLGSGGQVHRAWLTIKNHESVIPSTVSGGTRTFESNNPNHAVLCFVQCTEMGYHPGVSAAADVVLLLFCMRGTEYGV